VLSPVELSSPDGGRRELVHRAFAHAVLAVVSGLAFRKVRGASSCLDLAHSEVRLAHSILRLARSMLRLAELELRLAISCLRLLGVATRG
jgi:hypothetical protein